MMNFASAFATIPSILKTVDEMTVAFESKGNGPAKKQAVLDSMSAIYDVASNVTEVPLPFSKQEVMTFATSAVDVVVNLKNNLGTFEHTIVSDVKNTIEHVVDDVKTGVENIAHDAEELFTGHEEAVKGDQPQSAPTEHPLNFGSNAETTQPQG